MELFSPHNNKPHFIENALQLGKSKLANGADNITRFKFSSIDLFLNRFLKSIVN